MDAVRPVSPPAAGMEGARSRGPRIFRLLALTAAVSALGFAAVLVGTEGLLDAAQISDSVVDDGNHKR